MDSPTAVAIIGAGPRGVGVLERLVANHRVLAPGLTLVVHLIDPHPPGAGRVWRSDQSALLRLNSMAADIAMFTDPSMRCDGPIEPGPTMAEWAHLVPPEELGGPELVAEAAALTPISFPTRRLGGEYLSWVFRRVVKALPPQITVLVHAATAVDVRDGGSVQRIQLDDGKLPLEVAAIVLTLGHLDNDPDTEAARLAAFATRHGCAYLPPAHGTESDLSDFTGGADVIVRGFGLGFVDLLVLLTEGRGGTYTELGGGRLRYEPCGDEPRLHIGSRRGTPYHAKLTYELIASRPPLPRFLTRAAVRELTETHDPLLFRRDAWPLIAKEIAWAGYHELALGHPDRVVVAWADLDAQLAALDWGTPAWDRVVASAVPDPADRIDFDELDRPLAGIHDDDPEAFQRRMIGLVRADIDRRGDPYFSADLGVFNAFLAVFAQLPHVLGSRKLSPRSRSADFDDWWFGFFSSYASGPPPRRLEELIALAEVGIVRFLGADMWLRTDEGSGEFVAGSASTDSVVRARLLMDARLPGPSVTRTTSAVVRAMHRRGELAEHVLLETDGSEVANGQIRVSMADQRVVDAAGEVHQRRFALGPHSTSRAPAFSRPDTNAMAPRHNDIAARAVLSLLLDDRGSRRVVAPGAPG